MTSRSNCLRAIAIAAVAACAHSARAQQRVPPDVPGARLVGPLSLSDVLRRALRDDPDVLLSAQAADAALGVAISAHAVYDATVQTSVTHTRQNTLRLVPAAGGSADPGIASALTSSVTSATVLSQKLPWAGIVLAPQVSVTSSGSPGTDALSRASTSLGVTVPLARDRMGALSHVVEGAANAEADATHFDLRQAQSSAMQGAANAYWSFLAAQRRLAVSAAAEARARQNVDQTLRLVAADERPAADLVQLRGNVASKMAARINAEQSVLESWRALTTVLGLRDVAVSDLPVASTDFPVLPDSAALQPPPSDAQRQALIADALRRRPDLGAASMRVRELQLDVATGEQLLRPVIDVVGQIGYAGIEQGWGVQNFVSPLYRHGSPLNASLQISYSFAAGNSDAAGRVRQALAGLDQQRTARGSVERAIATGVVVAIEGVRRAITAAQAAHVATEAAQQSVNNEWRKFRLGSSTVFDITNAEDGLTNAQLTEVAARQGYATAIVRLQFELGSIIVGERQNVSPNVDELLRAPSIIANP